MAPARDKDAQKAKAKARQELNYRIAGVAATIEKQMNKVIEEEAGKLGVDVRELRARFLAYASERGNEAKPTVWNGLIHVKSKEWADEKERYPGAQFMGYVIERIHSEGLYNLAEMSDEEQDTYLSAAQEARKARLNAGAAKTSTQRLLQGSVKNELAAICNRLDYLNFVTSIECVLFVVKGQSQDGLAPTYYASDKARTFIESHLSVPVPHMVELMESSVIGGAGALAKCSRTQTQLVKSDLRRVALKSLRDAATSTAEDGSPPTITDPFEIAMVEYKNYVNIIQQYKVKMVGWPFNENGSLVDPSSMGLATLRKYLKLLQQPDSNFGFKRMTGSEWEEWNKSVDAGIVKLPTRKTRSDAGKKRKRQVEAPSKRPAEQEHKKADRTKGSKSNKAPTKGKSSRGNKRAPKQTQGSASEPPERATSPTSHDDIPPVPTTSATTPRVAVADVPHHATAFDQADFNFRAVDADPTAPAWPGPTHSRPSTPRPFPVPNPPIRKSKSQLAPSPRTPQRVFQVVLNTPESYAAGANSPRRRGARSRSPVVKFPLDPTLANAKIVPRTAK